MYSICYIIYCLCKFSEIITNHEVVTCNRVYETLIHQVHHDKSQSKCSGDQQSMQCRVESV